eukprot:scaffold260004_cov88-Attheya_sp.AAC.1
MAAHHPLPSSRGRGRIPTWVVHGGHTHNHRPPTVHSSFRGLVGVAIAVRLRVGTGAKRCDVG